MPDAGGIAEPAGELVGADDAGVAMDLEILLVVIFQERGDEERLGLGIEIGGHVADAELAVGRAIVGVRADRIGERTGVDFIVSALFAVKRFVIVAGMELEGVDHVAVNAGFDETGDERAAVTGDGVADVAAIFVGVAEVVDGVAHVGSECEGALVDGDGFVECPASFRAMPRLLVRFGEIRVDLDGALQDVDGVGGLAAHAQGGAEIGERDGEIRRQLECFVIGGDGFQSASWRPGRCRDCCGHRPFWAGARWRGGDAIRRGRAGLCDAARSRGFDALRRCWG